LARRAVRFGRALIFLCYFLCIKAKKVSKRYAEQIALCASAIHKKHCLNDDYIAVSFVQENATRLAVL